MSKLQMNRRGQGMTEYIVILGIVVAIAVAVLLPKLKPAIDGKVTNIVASIGS